MDRIDMELLKLLTKNARMPLNKLANQVFLSSPAVSSRIEKLEREGTIQQYTSVVDYRKLGYPITVFISLQLFSNQRPAFLEYLKNCPYILECYSLSGQFSVQAKAVFADTQELDYFLAEFSQFGQTKTEFVFSSLMDQKELMLDIRRANTKH